MLYSDSITKEVFLNNLKSSAERSIQFCRKYVITRLPDRYKLIVLMDAGRNENLKEGEIVYPETTDEHSEINPSDPELVADFLFRDGRIPEWIDVYVAYSDDDFSYVALWCCPRFTTRLDLLYHYRTGFPPFLVRTPPLPFDCKDEDGFIRKFNLNLSYRIKGIK